MKISSRIISLSLAALAVFSFASCSNDKNSSSGTENTSAVTETSRTTLSLVKSLHLNPLCLLMACYHHLSYTFTVINGKILL